MSRLICSALLIIWVPLVSLGQNVGVVIGSDRHDSLPDLNNDRAVSRAVEAMERAQFNVIALRDMTFDEAIAGLQDAGETIDAAQRIVVLVAGHVVNDGERSWLLARDAADPTPLDVGAQGIPIKALYDMVAQHPGAAVVLIAEQDRDPELAPGLAYGHARFAPPQGVTVFSGPARDLSDVLEDGLLVPGRSLAEIAEEAGEEVTPSGYLSRAHSFLSDESTEGREAVVSVEPEPEPLDPLAEAEAREDALGLTAEEKRTVQRNLELLDLDPRGIDGIFGPGTRAAVTAWQERNGEAATGFLTQTQISLLREQGNRRARELEAEAAARQAEQDRRDTAYWRQTGALGTEDGLRTYLQRYPDGLYASDAKEALLPFEEARRAEAAEADRRAWDAAKAEDTVPAYRAYLDARSDGAFAAEAEQRIAELQQAVGTDAARAEERQVAGNPVIRLLVEQRLVQLGADPGLVDGAFDENTRRAIRRFQAARDLPASGYVTRATMARLLAG